MVVSCSKGTYIRTLCHDIGKKLGCFGCMKSLLRTRVDRFLVEDSFRLSELENMVQQPQETWSFISAIDSVFLTYPFVTTKPEAMKLVVNGNRIPTDMIVDFSLEKQQETLRLYDCNHKFIGIYTYVDESQEYKPVKLFME